MFRKNPETEPHGMAMDQDGHIEHMGRVVYQDDDHIRLSCFDPWDFQLYGKTTESGQLVNVPSAACRVFEDRDSMLGAVYEAHMREIEDSLPF